MAFEKQPKYNIASKFNQATPFCKKILFEKWKPKMSAIQKFPEFEGFCI